MNRNIRSRVSLADYRPVHDNLTPTAKSLKGRNADQSNRTNNAFNKLQSYNSSIVGSKAGMFHIYFTRKQKFCNEHDFKFFGKLQNWLRQNVHRIVQ